MIFCKEKGLKSKSKNIGLIKILFLSKIQMSDSDVFSPNVYDPNISNPNIPAPNAPVSNIPDIDTISQHTNTKTDTKNLAKQLKGNIIRFSI